VPVTPPPALELSRILHAGYLLRHGGTTLAFDPIFEDPFSRNCHAFPPVRFHLDQVRALRLDAVFLSHHHDDHCSLESLDLLDRDTPIYLYCVVEGLHDLIRALGFRHVHALVLDVPVGVGDVRVTPRRALDAEVDAMFHIEAAGLSVLNVVDAWIDPDTLEALAAYAPWDLVLWPFQTMRELEVLTPSRATPAARTLPPEWLEQLRRLAPRAVVPSSCQLKLEPWSWYNDVFFPITYKQFGAELRATVPGVDVVRLDPGASVRLDRAGLTRIAPLPWVNCLATEPLDYHYDATTTIPSTAEVAAHFPPPSPAQVTRVLDYCRHELPVRLEQLGPPEEPYFGRPRWWRLSLYDHAGQVTHLYYRLHEELLEPVEAPGGPLGWTTELPLIKLYAALEDGESLTSLYVRINEGPLAASDDVALAAADVLEDPLVRGLYAGTFAAYQRAQLRRIEAARRPVDAL
jgi:L-ascorbate metabolism protein UlaG (beta-lactamase superfamily)